MIKVEPIKAFGDNYIWCIHDEKNAVVIDPGNADVVITYLKNKNLNLMDILLTHHHKDHIGGVNELISLYNNINVYSSIPELATNLIADGDIIKLNLLDCYQFKVIAVPGHTLDHVVFYGHDMLFCGDTLFSAGCGRVFEGTYEQMYNSLMSLRSLNGTTMLYPAHEYTLKNIDFAVTIDPNNELLIQHQYECRNLVAKNLPTLPVQLGAEKLINPFLRCDVIELKTSINLIDSLPIDIFTYIRNLKNSF